MTDHDTPSGPRSRDDGATAATHDHGSGRGPSGPEAHAADRFLAEQDPEDAERVAEHHEAMRRIGADVKGEGEID